MARIKVKRLAVALFATVAVAAGGLATAAPASASGPGSCYIGADGCLYYNYNYAGGDWGTGAASFINFDYATFGCQGTSSCAGNTYLIKNDAASAANFRNDGNFCVYYNSEFQGASDWFARYNQLGWYGNLVSTYKEDASNSFMAGGC